MGERRRQVVGGFFGGLGFFGLVCLFGWFGFLGFGLVFFFLRSCGVILFYFLTLQAAGRMTWLPGKLLGRCTGLLPASRHQKCLPSARQHSPQQGCPLPPASPCPHPHHTRPQWTGAEPAASQASAPTLPRLGANPRLPSHGESPAQGPQCTVSPRPPARTG